MGNYVVGDVVEAKMHEVPSVWVECRIEEILSGERELILGESGREIHYFISVPEIPSPTPNGWWSANEKNLRKPEVEV